MLFFNTNISFNQLHVRSHVRFHVFADVARGKARLHVLCVTRHDRRRLACVDLRTRIIHYIFQTSFTTTVMDFLHDNFYVVIKIMLVQILFGNVFLPIILSLYSPTIVGLP